ncbi:ABC-2 transporter permease [Neofamilia massiliensis]|uniref:ABC-2 transporter permease n=1 Tax=Neofamilia massiliensis TaxID=1673724 RepID=UPI0006BB8DDE|nr:ABC-2 transporter permease [Neofamilia massiliensis]
MLAYLKKDLIIISKDLKIYLPMLLILVFFIGARFESVIFLCLFYMLMMIFTTFSYEEQSNFYSYAAALPSGRKKLVAGKYISSLVLISISLLLSLGFYFLMRTFNEVPDFSDFIKLLPIGFLFISLYISLVIPSSFKFGSNIGRIVTILVPFIIVMVGKIMDQEVIEKISEAFINTSWWIYILLGFVCLGISYFISNAIVKNKDF